MRATLLDKQFDFLNKAHVLWQLASFKAEIEIRLSEKNFSDEIAEQLHHKITVLDETILWLNRVCEDHFFQSTMNYKLYKHNVELAAENKLLREENERLKENILIETHTS